MLITARHGELHIITASSSVADGEGSAGCGQRTASAQQSQSGSYCRAGPSRPCEGAQRWAGALWLSRPPLTVLHMPIWGWALPIRSPRHVLYTMPKR
jgi:hypothetical protein